MQAKIIKFVMQLLLVLILLIPIHVWGISFGWDPSALSLFLLFPLLGLLAFSIMYTQVVVGTFQKQFSKYINISKFYAKSGLAVLILFVSHPLIALISLYMFQGSINPYHLVSESNTIFIILAQIAFVTFIAFEVVNRTKNTTIKKFRPFIENASYIGVILVWIHSLNIGSHTGSGWFHYLWLFYGITAILMITKIFLSKLKSK